MDYEHRISRGDTVEHRPTKLRGKVEEVFKGGEVLVHFQSGARVTFRRDALEVVDGPVD